jgi:hypothetical protein
MEKDAGKAIAAGVEDLRRHLKDAPAPPARRRRTAT